MKSWEREYGGGEENKGEEKEKREGEGERRRMIGVEEVRKGRFLAREELKRKRE